MRPGRARRLQRALRAVRLRVMVAMSLRLRLRAQPKCMLIRAQVASIVFMHYFQ